VALVEVIGAAQVVVHERELFGVVADRRRRLDEGAETAVVEHLERERTLARDVARLRREVVSEPQDPRGASPRRFRLQRALELGLVHRPHAAQSSYHHR